MSGSRDTPDFGSEEEVTRLQRISELETTVDDLNIASVMNTQAGRAVIWRILGKAGVYRQSYDGSKNGTLFREGQRSIGLFLLDQILTKHANLYTLMQTEAIAREERSKELNG